MKKRIFILICALLIIFSQVSCAKVTDDADAKSSAFSATVSKATSDTAASKEPQDESLSTPYFWKVTGNGYNGEFYLLGSIHVGDKNTNSYPDQITEAFKKCEYLAVESDIVAIEKNLSAQIDMTQAVMYTDGSKINDHIDKELYEAAREILTENKLYNKNFDILKPAYWYMLIDNIYLDETDYSANYGVDRYFIKKANKAKKEILEIEDAVETYKAIGALSDKTQELLLKDVVNPEYRAYTINGTKELYSVWKKGDITGKEDLLFDNSTEGMTAEEIAASEEYNNMLLTTRNENMANAAAEYLESGKNVFYIVGLAHFIGEDSVISQLTEMGYTVTQIKY